MIKEGDRVEWNTVNGVARAVIVKDQYGRWLAKVDDRTVFPIKDIRYSRSVRLIKA